MGLGPGEISVPSFLAKEELIRNSFSMCFDEEDSGRIYLGDKGPATQQSTKFLPSDGKYLTDESMLQSLAIQVIHGNIATRPGVTQGSPLEAHVPFEEQLCGLQSSFCGLWYSENFMNGYRMVFDREIMRLGWSFSNCQDLADGKRMSLSPNSTPSNPLPTNEQQSTSGGRAVAPALAGMAPSKPSVAPTRLVSSQFVI